MDPSAPQLSPNMDVEKIFGECAEIEAKHKVTYDKHQADRQHKVNAAQAGATISDPNTTTRDKLTLTTLPLDVVHCIFDRLDPASSTCLGLTCKAFYNIHRDVHGKVELKTPILDTPQILADLVREFFADPWFSYEVKKFVPVARFFEINHQRLLTGIARTREALDRISQNMEL